MSGLTTQEFMHWFHNATQAELLAGNPEHYIIVPKQNEQEVCETMGCYGLPIFFRIFFTKDESVLPVKLAEGYDVNLLAYGETYFHKKPMETYAIHQFRNTDDGCEVLLQVVFPDGVPKELVAGHQIHLAIEFNNWIKMAYQAKS